MSRDQTTEREFFEELAELNRELQADIAAHAIGLDPSKEARAARRSRVLHEGDFEFFAYTYFPHHIRGTPSIFQKQFCERFPQIIDQTSGAKEWWIAPRGEAKSSLLTKVGPVWCAVRGLLQRKEVRDEFGWHVAHPIPPFVDYLLLLGAETRLPTKLLEVIKTELTFNSALSLDFPDACGRGPMWKVGEFITKTKMKVEPFGAEQAVRGTFHGSARPKVLMGDDLITDSEAKSPTERENRWSWLAKGIEYLGPPDGSVKFLGVGTVLDKDDPVSRAKRTIGHIVHHFRAIERLPTHMDMWSECQEIMLNEDKPAQEEAVAAGKVLPDTDLPSHLFYLRNQAKMDEGAIVSWPSVRSLYKLMRQRAANPKAFGTEMQGDPRSDEDKVFDHITFWVNRLSMWLPFGGCDPSMGANERSDPSALLIGFYARELYQLHVEVATIKRRVPSKLSADLIKLQREFKCLAWGFENNNAYEHSRLTFINDGMAAGVPLPLVGYPASVPQEVRIDSLEPFVTDRMAPRILFSSGLTQLLTEMDSWPEKQPGHHYDGLCGLYWLWIIATSGIGSMAFTAGDSRASRWDNVADPDADDDMPRDEAGGW